MPLAAIVEVAVDALGAQCSYDGSWPPSDWPRLAKLSVAPHFHPASRAVLCAVWSFLGFPRPLMSLQNGSAYGWPVAASIAAQHPPYAGALDSLRAAMQQPIPLRATLSYLLRLTASILTVIVMPIAFTSITLWRLRCLPSWAVALFSRVLAGADKLHLSLQTALRKVR